MALGETIVAATAGLAGAGVGAWATTRATTVGLRQAEITTARAELAAVHEFIWTRRTPERTTRLAALRYRLIALEVPDEALARLLERLETIHRELDDGRQAVSEGLIGPEEAGVPQVMIDAAVAAADDVARSLPKADAGPWARFTHRRRRRRS